MNEKLSFEVNNVGVIDENPDSKFAVLEFDFFASGQNRHNIFVSEEVLRRTAETIKNCPIVWKYDEILDDVYTHDDEEVPCGFVPETAEIKEKKLDDGRTMLSVIAYVWKKYTGSLLDIFKRDGGKKPVSVEMRVNDMYEDSKGNRELKDFRYEGVTILGSYVTPAIPGAMANVLSFSQDLKEEYEKDYISEFSNPDINLKIPQKVKENAKKGIELYKKYKYGANALFESFANYLINNEEITPEKAKYISSFFEGNSNSNFHFPSPDNYISWHMMGGDEGYEWSKSLLSEIIEYGGLLTFPYKSREDMNSALKGISPPITVAQANQIARQADAIESDGDKNGWAIAIANFKKTHIVKNGTWVKKDENMSIDNNNKKEIEMDELKKLLEKFSSGEELTDEEEALVKEHLKKQEEDETFSEDNNDDIDNNESNDNEDFASEDKEDDSKEDKEDEDGEDKDEGDEEDMEDKKKYSFEYPEEFDFDAVKTSLAELESDNAKMLLSECEKGKEYADPKNIILALFGLVKYMKDNIGEMKKEREAYMQENKELKEFKAEVEESRKNFAVDEMLTELSEKYIVPEDSMEELVGKAKEYSLDTLDEWKNYAKALSFDFEPREKSESDVTKVGIPFTSSNKQEKESLWD